MSQGSTVAISEKSRSSLYQALSPIAGEEAVGEMLSYFPSRDIDEPVTKEFLRAEMATLRAEFADLRAGFAELEGGIHAEANRMLVWLIGTMIAVVGLGVTVTVGVMVVLAG
jgi:hypothetical protein